MPPPAVYSIHASPRRQLRPAERGARRCLHQCAPSRSIVPVAPAVPVASPSGGTQGTAGSIRAARSGRRCSSCRFSQAVRVRHCRGDPVGRPGQGRHKVCPYMTTGWPCPDRRPDPKLGNCSYLDDESDRLIVLQPTAESRPAPRGSWPGRSRLEPVGQDVSPAPLPTPRLDFRRYRVFSEGPGVWPPAALLLADPTLR